MSYKSIDLCIQKAHEDELLFVLMARDETAPEVVMEWVQRNLNKQPIEKLVEAIKCAQAMHDTQRMHNKRAHPPRFDTTTTQCPDCKGAGYTNFHRNGDGSDMAFTICENCKGLGWGVIYRDEH